MDTERFIATQNVEHYRQLLTKERDPAKRLQIERLLAEARTSLDRLPARPPAQLR